MKEKIVYCFVWEKENIVFFVKPSILGKWFSIIQSLVEM